MLKHVINKLPTTSPQKPNAIQAKGYPLSLNHPSLRMSHSKPQTPVWRPPPNTPQRSRKSNRSIIQVQRLSTDTNSQPRRVVPSTGRQQDGFMYDFPVRPMFYLKRIVYSILMLELCFFFSSSTHPSYIRRGHSNVAEQNATSMAEIECPLQLTPYPPRSYVQVHRLRASPPWLPLSTYVHFCLGRRTHVTTNPIINCEHVRNGFFYVPPPWDEIVDLFISR